MINNMTLSPHIYILTRISLDRVSNSVGIGIGSYCWYLIANLCYVYERHACLLYIQ